MIAEDGNIFEDETIVEFKFDKDSNVSNDWRWIPIKVRYDKTYAYRKGESNFAMIIKQQMEYGNQFIIRLLKIC